LRRDADSQMAPDLLKNSVTRSLVAAFVSEDQVEAMVRPVFERYGLSPEEIEALVAQTRANVRAWKAAAGVDVPGMAAAAASGLLHALGIPTRNELGELARRLDALAAQRGCATAAPAPAPGARS
jgi:hypothetical protein